MHNRSGLVKNLLRAGLTTSAILVAVMARMASADDLFVFPDEAALSDAMATLSSQLTSDTSPPNPCRLDIMNDLRGETLFDKATLESMNQALAVSVLGLGKVDDCVIKSHEISQDDVIGFLQQQNKTGEVGIAIVLSYYKIGDRVTTLATLRDVDGRLLGSTTGLFDLPARPAAGSNIIARTQSDEIDGSALSERLSNTIDLTATKPADLAPAVVPEPVVAKQQPLPVDDVRPVEASLRRQLAEEKRIATSLAAPFNLRRIEAGIPSPIETVWVVDAGGLDMAMMGDLAENFTDAQELDADAIDIESSNAPAAFAQILNNEVDVVVTR